MTTVPGAKLSVTAQRGLELVYCDAESVIAALVSQLPRAGMDPESLIVWPYVVVTVSSKVTAMDVDVQVAADVLVVLELVAAAVEVVEPDDCQWRLNHSWPIANL